ncbi:MAG: hypothetical protein ACRC2R_17005 [Xenococcaceae cyanobacterium]
MSKYTYIGDDARILMYINSVGKVFGSFAAVGDSEEASEFAQISGKHDGNKFQIVFTRPSGMSVLILTSNLIKAIAKWQKSKEEFLIAGEKVRHLYSFTFKRIKPQLIKFTN